MIKLLLLLAFVHFTYTFECNNLLKVGPHKICKIYGENTKTAVNKSEITWILLKPVNPISLTKDLCEEFPNLQTLNIEPKTVTNIDEDAFESCAQLSHLSIVSNNLHELNSHLFERNYELQFLEMTGNHQMKQIDGAVLKFTKKLRELRLTSNELEQFSLESIPKLEYLKYLDLSCNYLTDLDENLLLEKFPVLKHVLLDHNLFECERLVAILEKFRTREVNVSMKNEMGRCKKHFLHANLSKIENIQCVKM